MRTGTPAVRIVFLFTLMMLTWGSAPASLAWGQGGYDAPSFSPWIDPEFPPRTREAQLAEPFQIFDNLYYVGLQSVGSFLITTSQGLILIDPTYHHTAELVLASVRKLGFNPTDIEYVLVTHGHRDHAGGAQLIRDATGARIVMAKGDWEIYQNPEPAADYPIIPLDMVAEDNSLIELGDTTVRLLVTPGHTPGCLTMEYTVFDQGKPYRALSPGGLGLPSGDEKIGLYLESVRRMREVAGVQVLLPNHPFMGATWERAKKLASRTASDPHPFVESRPDILSWFDTLYNAMLSKQFFDQRQLESRAKRGSRQD